MSISAYNRRRFLTETGLGALSLILPSFSFPKQTRKRKPNIILIMADDLGYEGLSCNGSLSYKTPHLDKLARTGVRFTHCYSQPLCTPSRVQIMTGQYNFRNYTEFGALHPKEITFGHILQKAGYATCVVGKWQLAARNKGIGTYPDKAGFDEHCLWQVDKLGSRYRSPLIQENSKIRDDLKGKYGPDVFLDYIQGFMERKKKGPFSFIIRWRLLIVLLCELRIRSHRRTRTRRVQDILRIWSPIWIKLLGRSLKKRMNSGFEKTL